MQTTNAILIGWASRDVTPDRPVNLMGQFHVRISKGVKDPVTVTALALSSEEAGSTGDAIVFVSCDTALVTEAIVAQCRQAVHARLPMLDVRKLVINATHTHTAPQLCDLLAYPPPPAGVMTAEEYAELFVAKVADAATEAWQNRHRGGVSWGLGTAVVGHNRRVTYFDDAGTRPNKSAAGHYADGFTKMYGKTDDPKFSHIEGYEDHYVNLLYTWDEENQLTGVVVNLACPSQEIEGDYYISADFWHDIRLAIRERLGANVQVLGQCAAAGDQSPHVLWYKRAEERMLNLRGLSEPSYSPGSLNQRREIGRRVAATVAEVFPLMRQDILTDPPLTHVVREIGLPRRMITEAEADEVKADLAKLEAQLPTARNPDAIHVSISRCRQALERYELQKTDPLCRMELHVIRLGDISFVTNGFELFLDFGLRIKARSPSIQTFAIQLVGWGGYLPTDRAVAGKGYSGGIYDSTVSPEGGQTLVEETVATLKTLWPARPPATL